MKPRPETDDATHWPKARPPLVPVMSSFVGRGGEALSLVRLWSLLGDTGTRADRGGPDRSGGGAVASRLPAGGAAG